MSAPQSGDGDGLITDINVTPLVDIMLVLLIIFMLTAHIIAKQAIEVQLPKAATGAQTQPTVLGLALDGAGILYLNGNAISEPELRRALADVAGKDKEARAMIAADKALSHGTVVHLIDLVRQSGIDKFALSVEPDATPAVAP